MADDLGIPVSTNGASAGAATVSPAAGNPAPQAAPTGQQTAPAPAQQPVPDNIGGGGGPAGYIPGEARHLLSAVQDAAGFIGDYTNQSQSLTNYGADDAYLAKMDRTRKFSEKLSQLQQMPPDKQAEILKSAGLTPEDLPGIVSATGATLKEQQEQMGKISAAAGEEAQRVGTEAEGKPAKTISTLGAVATNIAMLGIFPAAAVEFAGTPMGTAAIMAEIAKAYTVMQASNAGGDLATKMVHKIYPNAGPLTDMATQLIGGLITGLPTGHAIEAGGAPWLAEAQKETPEVNATVEDTNHTLKQEPIGMKDPYEKYIVSKESIERDKQVAMLQQAAKQQQQNVDYEHEYQGATPQPPEATSPSGPPRIAEPEPPPEPEKAPGERENLPPGEVPEHLKAEAPDEGPQTARGQKYADRGPIQHIRDVLGKSIWEILKKNERGSISTRELTEEQKDAIRSSFGEWAIPVIAGAQKAGDQDTLDKFSGLLKPEDEKAFNIPPPEQKLVNASDRAAKTREATETPSPAAGKEPAEEPAEEEEPAPTTRKAAMAAAYKALQQKQGEMFDRLGLVKNEDVANEAVKVKSNAVLSDEDMAKYQAASQQSLDNIRKLAVEHLDAAAHDDNDRVGTIGDLFQHETAKLAYLQHATGESTEDIAQSVANASAQSSDILQIVGAERGLKAEVEGKTAATMGWQRYLDPANIAVSNTLFSPPLWLAKAVTDSVWLTYQNALKGLSYAISGHPADAISMWGASLKGVTESFGDAVRYGGEAFKYGGRSAEVNLGMMKGENNISQTLFDDYADTNAGEAIQYLASVYTDGVAGKVKQAAGMALNVGPRVILAEDQFAKTFAFRAAARTAAFAKAILEANEKGLKGSDRTQWAWAQGESYVNDMPDWLVKQASDEAYQHTFTAYNGLASKVQQLLSYGTVSPGAITKWSPEMHIGRLMGGLYVTTPMNIMKEGFLNSPFALMMPREMGLIGENASIPAARLAMTKMAAGTALMAYLYMHAGQLHLTGSGDAYTPEERQLRNDLHIPNYSIGIAGHYFSYEHLGPINIPLQFAANMAELHGVASQANKGAYVQQALGAFAQVVNHAPLMHMFPNIFHALANAGMGNTDELQKYLTETATSLIQPAIVKEITQALDPVMRTATDNVHRLLLNSPYRSDVPLKRDHWGNVQYVPPGYEADEIPPNPLEAFLYVMSPFHQQVMPKIDDVDAEIVRVGAEMKPVDKMFIGSAGPTGLRADPNNPKVGVPYHPTDEVQNAKLKDELEVLLGHELQIDGMNQHDYMRDEINSDYYKSLEDSYDHQAQAEDLEKIHQMFYEQARQELQDRHPDLDDRVQQRQADQAAARAGTKLGAP